jgi:hypothetical protein
VWKNERWQSTGFFGFPVGVFVFGRALAALDCTHDLHAVLLDAKV